MTASNVTSTYRTEDLDNMPPLVCPDEVAPYVSTSGRQIRRMLTDGTIQGAKVGTHWRVNLKSFRAYFGI